MSRKKGQLLSEISQNLKQTIKKYNELAMDDNFFKEEKNNNNNNNNDGLSLLKINELDEDINNLEQFQSNFTTQLNTLMNNLNILEENINKDFDELENYIENDIEKELISK